MSLELRITLLYTWHGDANGELLGAASAAGAAPSGRVPSLLSHMEVYFPLYGSARSLYDCDPSSYGSAPSLYDCDPSPNT